MKFSFARAFTLIELLVVVAIIGIVSSIALVSIGDGKNMKDVEGAALIASGKIREAQTAALTGKQYAPNTTPCAYRIIWGSTDLTSAYVYKDGSDNCNLTTTISSFTLSSGVTFTDSGSIDFVLPHGRIASSQVLSLQKSTSSQVICVKVDGRVEVKANAGSC